MTSKTPKLRLPSKTVAMRCSPESLPVLKDIRDLLEIYSHCEDELVDEVYKYLKSRSKRP